MAHRPGIDDLTGDHELAILARETWLTSTKAPKVLPNTISKIWKTLETGDFARFDLLLLEQLQALERYLWPGYSTDASNQHVLLLVLLVNTKRREHLSLWSIFNGTPDEFADFFSRITHLSIDTSLPTKLRTFIVEFLVGAFQSLDQSIVRKECPPLVSIGIWQNIHNAQVREGYLARNPHFVKAWKTAIKRFEGADAAGQTQLRFERSWLNTLLIDFLDKVYDTNTISEDNVLYCGRVLELLCDLQSQYPTRRYVNTLVQNLNVLPALALSPMVQDNAEVRDMFKLLQHYTLFPIDDATGRQLSEEEYDGVRNVNISRLQQVGTQLQPEKLKILILSNFGSLSDRGEIQSHLTDLTDQELAVLCQGMGLRTSEYPENCALVRDREYYLELIISLVEARPLYTEALQHMAVLPTEQDLYDQCLLRVDRFNGSHPLPVPKLNLQYLTVGDFLWRSFILYRHEAFYEIRSHLQDTIKRLQPKKAIGSTRFDGFSRMAIPIPKPAVIEVVPAQVGESIPHEVKVEVILDVSRLQPGLRREWEALRTDDVVYLLALQPPYTAAPATNGHSIENYAERVGLKNLRCAEVISVLDENGRVLRNRQDAQDLTDGGPRIRQRRLLLRLDAVAYAADKARVDEGKADVLDSVNLIVRRKSRENNFKPVLETIRHLALADTPVPTWLQEVFLGYGDPSSASYKRLSSRLNSVDYRDTFLDWQHLIESLPGKTVEPDPTQNGSFPPPYVLESTLVGSTSTSTKGKKRRRDQPDGPEIVPGPETVKVSTYKPPNNGPYPSDAPKLNHVRFTPTQIEAITSGSQPGLTVIVGPPGTGKTDVATQIINNIYHQHPDQRTLLIAHSNQALNQLFQKIVDLDIDERHLLRLGHGEEELDSESSFSRAGRVESFLSRGAQYLVEVQRLSASISAPGAHGSSCETAEYFDQVYVRPRWKRFWDAVRREETVSTQFMNDSFPFLAYFADAPQPLFPLEASSGRLTDIAKGCERHIRRIFEELADIRPFEILRAQRDKSNYLLVKEARIIAMTSTHAAMRRQEIALLGFKYDNIVMEEAAQITEIEDFIPFVMQNPKSEKGTPAASPLQRLVLVGDHLQNSPIIQNSALKTYSQFDQSLFQRLIRVGVPHIALDAQGRSRPSLAALYKWRYPQLSNLPATFNALPFTLANPGLRYDYQFISVPDYDGAGETSPSPHSYQNKGEAEYVVALYQYLRLLDYPASRITILTSYAAQRALIRDVLNYRCRNPLFGMPKHVSTIDKYQGEQNDYIILSFVRTTSPGYLRDLRRVTVALSRARLGLYVFGRREVFESSLELREAFAGLLSRKDKLEVVTGEMYGTCERKVDDDVQAAEMTGVEHLGQYVAEMTRARVQALKEGNGVLAALDGNGKLESSEDEEEENGMLDDGYEE